MRWNLSSESNKNCKVPRSFCLIYRIFAFYPLSQMILDLQLFKPIFLLLLHQHPIQKDFGTYWLPKTPPFWNFQKKANTLLFSWKQPTPNQGMLQPNETALATRRRWCVGQTNQTPNDPKVPCLDEPISHRQQRSQRLESHRTTPWPCLSLPGPFLRAKRGLVTIPPNSWWVFSPPTSVILLSIVCSIDTLLHSKTIT